ncbi:hypothetical protein Dimus_039248 [Dionaea muscipula]
MLVIPLRSLIFFFFFLLRHYGRLLLLLLPLSPCPRRGTLATSRCKECPSIINNLIDSFHDKEWRPAELEKICYTWRQQLLCSRFY